MTRLQLYVAHLMLSEDTPTSTWSRQRQGGTHLELDEERSRSQKTKFSAHILESKQGVRSKDAVSAVPFCRTATAGSISVTSGDDLAKSTPSNSDRCSSHVSQALKALLTELLGAKRSFELERNSSEHISTPIGCEISI